MEIVIPQRVIFDTNVFVDAANGYLRKGFAERWILPEDWRCAAAFVDRSFLYAISPITVIELLSGIDQGEPQYFEQNRASLRKVIHPFAARTYLPFIRYFVQREVFGIDASYPPELEDDFETVIDIVLSASTKDDLASKSVPFKGQKAGIALKKLREERRTQQELWRVQTAVMKANPDWNPNREMWSAHKAVDMRVPETANNLKILSERLDACFYWEVKCIEMARNPDCKFKRAQGLMMDANQLAYLAAPDVLLVTRDEEVAHAVQASSQRDRIVSWSKFLNLAKISDEKSAVGI